MKLLFVGLFLMGTLFPFALSASTERSQGYSCFAPANPRTGFLSDFVITLSALEMGGDISLTIDGETDVIAKINRVSTLRRDDEKTGAAFKTTLEAYSESDVSGITDLDAINNIHLFRSLGHDHDFGVLQFMGTSGVLGGTFYSKSLATKCLPQ